ncbi:MAG: M28 family peptidase [Bacteroidales bacterium]|nr:M28 family peptidase [Bacteroidales bacterium]
MNIKPVIFQIFWLISVVTLNAQVQSKHRIEVFGEKEEHINDFTGDIYFLPYNTVKLPDFSTLVPVGKIYANSLHVIEQDFLNGFPGVTNRYEYFAIVYKGEFYINDSNLYYFLLCSDDGSKLYIDQELIIDNDYQHMITCKSNSIVLKKGSHKIEVQYFQGPRTRIALSLMYKKNGDSDYQIFNLSELNPVSVFDKDSAINISIGNEILFKYNSFELSDMAKKTLSDIKRLIIDKTEIDSIIIEGHTDNIGSDNYNLQLSVNRAKSVMKYLGQLGIDLKYMHIKGYGKSKPRVPNTDDESRQKNRRIELLVLKNLDKNISLNSFKDSISSRNLEEHILYLCDRNLGGRKFATPGERNAATYIQNQFAKSGLLGNFNTIQNYSQNFVYSYDTLISFNIENENKRLYYLSDFFTFEFCFLSDADKIEIVYAGFGLDGEDYSDYKNIDVKNKWVVVEINSPLDTTGKLTDYFDFVKPVNLAEISEKKENAKKHGAQGIIFKVNSQRYVPEVLSHINTNWHLYRSMDNVALNHAIGTFPAIIARSGSIDSLMGINSEHLKRHIDTLLKSGQSPAGFSKTDVSFRIVKQNRAFKSQNLIGVLEGEDKKIGLIISAHYDAVGTEDSIFYPGANDNASGTSAVIELGNLFSKITRSGYMPQKSIAFITFSGEEEGLVGSGFFIKNKPFFMDNETFTINLDCIGVLDTTKFKNAGLYVAAPENVIYKMQDRLIQIASQEKKPLTLEFSQNYQHSDNACFTYAGYPSIHLLTGWGEMHTPGDNPETINYNNLETVTRFVFNIILSQILFIKTD